MIISLAGAEPLDGGVLSWGPARAWDALRGVYRASLGPDDPRVRCAASRAARAISLDPGYLGPAAALAAGAAELFSRPSSVESGNGEDPGGWPRAVEEKFALDVLEATRAELARTPGWNPDAPFPAPAYGLETALYPGPASPGPVRPGPGELRAALAAAELDGAGSAEALTLRSRLGEAVADAEAWARASVTTLFSGSSPASLTSRGSGGSGSSPAAGASGTPVGSGISGEPPDSGTPAGASRDESSLALLRSASEGLDSLLGRTHPDSLDARERLAWRLAGFSGPGLPPDPLEGERPPEEDILEAMGIFMETAAVRAWAASRPGPARDAGFRALPPDAERAAGLLRRTSDERALAAAASAGECGLVTGMTEEEVSFLEAARLAVTDTLDREHPVALRFMAHSCERLFRGEKFEAAETGLRLLSISLKKRFGASARETVWSSLMLGTMRLVGYDGIDDLDALDPAIGSFSEALEALEALEDAGGSGTPSAADPARGPGLPPGRAGRDRLDASTQLARCLCTAGASRHALGVLGPFLDSLPRLPPGREPEGEWPWPPELAGRALCVAGEAAADMDDCARGEPLLRRSLELLGPEPEDGYYQVRALEYLAGILGERGGRDRLSESADLSERMAAIMFRSDGPDSSAALDALCRAAACREAADDCDASLELHRKVLAARTRLLGPADKSTRESRENVSRLEGKLGGKRG
jgi:hypothetical protein